MYAKITRDIQECLNRQSVPREEIVEMAHEYTEACEQVNQRAARVVTLLNQGYRIEALEYADQRPALLELMHQLDFSSLQRWEDRLAAEGLPKSTGVDRTSAELVEDAYDEVRNLENQLKQNRMLALSQAPLPARITVLKRLAQKDPVNPLWKMDIENLERARIEQIQDEFEYARKRNDLEKLESLEEELSRKWEIPISKSVKQRITKGRDKIGINAAKQRMQKTARALNEAFMAYDTEQGFQLRMQWDEDDQIAQLDTDDPLWAEVREAFAWLDEATEQQFSDDDFGAAVGQLEQAIEQRVPLSELEQKIYAVQKFDREIPPSLVQRVNLYRRQIATGEKRSFVTIAISAVLIILLLAGGIYGLIQFQQARAKVAETVQQLQGLTEDYTSAQAYFDKLPEELQSNPQVSALLANIKSEYDNEERRKQEFQASIDRFDLKGDLGYQMDTILDEAEALAINEQETEKIGLLRESLDGERSQRASKRNMEFTKSVATISEKSGISDEEKSREKIRQMIGDLDTLMATSNGQIDGRATVNQTSMQLATSLMSRLEQAIQVMEKSDAANQAVKELPSAEVNTERFLTALNDFSEAHGEHPLAADFKSTSQELALWEELKKWQLLVAVHQWDGLYNMKNTDATILLQEIEDLRTNIHELALEKQTDELKEVLTKLADPDQKTPKQLSDDIRDFLDNEAHLRYLQWAIIKGKYYYLVKPPSQLPKEETRIYYYLATDDANAEKNDKFRDNRAKDPEIDYIGEAGHVLVTRQILSVDEEDFDNIHDYGIHLVKIALSAQNQGENSADPFGRALIFDFLLEEVGKASAPCKFVFDDLREEMKPVKLFTTNWFLPGQAVAEQRREMLKGKIFPKAITKIKELEAKLKSQSSEKSDMLNWQKQIDLKAIGWVRQTDSGEWKLESLTKFDKEQEAWMILPTGAGTTKGELKKIGTISIDGTINTETPEAMKNGRPVLTNKK